MTMRATGMVAALAIATVLAGGSGPVSASADVGTKVLLGAGKVTKFRWTARAFRKKGSDSATRPCLEIDLKPLPPSPPDPLEIPVGDVSCRPFRPTPAVLGVADEIDKPRVEAFVFAFPRRVQKLALEFRGQLKDRVIKLPLLSAEKAKKAGLEPFRYGSFALSGKSCLTRFIALSASGTVIEDGGKMGCSTGH